MGDLPENMHIYSQDDFVIQDGGEFMISELIREKIIRKLGDELPHDIFVEINISSPSTPNNHPSLLVPMTNVSFSISTIKFDKGD